MYTREEAEVIARRHLDCLARGGFGTVVDAFHALFYHMGAAMSEELDRIDAGGLAAWEAALAAAERTAPKAMVGMPPPDGKAQQPGRLGLGDDTRRCVRRPHGYLEWRWAPGYLCELVNMEVEPEHRGKGTGTNMILEVAATPGCRGVYGFVAAGNAGMLRLYQRLGFRALSVPDYYGNGEHGVLIWRPTPGWGKGAVDARS